MTEVADASLSHQLLPLALQLLVESAVKHNVMLPSRPLHIDVATTAQGSLRVHNNFQKKAARPAFNHVGLANIAARYQLLAQTGPLVDDKGGQFTVTRPLLAPPWVLALGKAPPDSACGPGSSGSERGSWGRCSLKPASPRAHLCHLAVPMCSWAAGNQFIFRILHVVL